LSRKISELGGGTELVRPRAGVLELKASASLRPTVSPRSRQKSLDNGGDAIELCRARDLLAEKRLTALG
jgi:hypothetical protein